MTHSYLTAFGFGAILTGVAGLLGGSALAGISDDIVAKLSADGYSEVEIESQDATHILVEAEKDGVETTFVIDAQTGAILSSILDDDRDDKDDKDDDDKDDKDDDDKDDNDDDKDDDKDEKDDKDDD